MFADFLNQVYDFYKHYIEWRIKGFWKMIFCFEKKYNGMMWYFVYSWLRH